MIAETAEEPLTKQAVVLCLLNQIGEPYEDPDGCLNFVKKCLALCGIEIEGSSRLSLLVKDARNFIEVEQANFGDVAVFQELPFSKFHVAFMLDSRWAIQSSKSTNGVGRIEIVRAPWAQCLRGFYRHRQLCF